MRHVYEIKKKKETKTRESRTVAGTNGILLKDDLERVKAVIFKFVLIFSIKVTVVNWEEQNKHGQRHRNLQVCEEIVTLKEIISLGLHKFQLKA